MEGYGKGKKLERLTEKRKKIARRRGKYTMGKGEGDPSVTDYLKGCKLPNFVDVEEAYSGEVNKIKIYTTLSRKERT